MYCSYACKALAQAVGRRPPTQCNPKAKAAQRIVRYHIQTGRLQRPKRCSWCGRQGRIEAAHENYDRPLEVRWLCSSCHRKWDWADPKGGVTASDGRGPEKLPLSDARYQREIERCRREIAAARAELLAGNPDVEGLCLALADWHGELRILEQERRRAGNPAAEAWGG